jgi:hypothetical protein
MLSHIKRYAPIGISLFAAVVFLDSLRFKFTDHPNTQEIFGRLDGWAGTFGAAGLFAHTGLFSQYVIGSAELLASTLLLVGLLPGLARLNALGAAIGLAVMTGAVSFHVFTPLGIDPNNDGGGLFAAAVTIWVSAIALLFMRRAEIVGLIRDLHRAFVPTTSLSIAPQRAPAHA